MSCIPVGKDNALMPHGYSFTVQYTDHIETYLKQMILQRLKNVAKGAIYHTVNTADFEQKHQGI